MEAFPIERARQRLGFTPATSVRGDIDVSGTGGIGGAVGQAILGGIELGIKYDLKQANTQLSESQRLAEEEINRMKIRIGDNLDPETYQKEYSQSLERIKEFAPKNRRGKTAYDLWLNKKTPRWQSGINAARESRVDDNWDAEAISQISALSRSGDPVKLLEFERFLNRRQIIDPIDKTKELKWRTAARVAQVQGQLSKLKTLGTAGNLEQFNIARKLVQTSGVFDSKDTLAELQSIDILEKRTKSKSQDINHELDMKVNEDFLSKVMNKNLLPDEIAGSRLDRGDPALFGAQAFIEPDILNQQAWMDYSKASVEAPPKKSTPSGIDTMTGVVLDWSKKKLFKEAAYRRLLDVRYKNKAITDNDFQWAIDKIENPYPQHLVPDIEAMIETNKQAVQSVIGGWFDRRRETEEEQEEIKQLNQNLLEWIDKKLKDEKEPTRQEIYQRSVQLRIQGEERSSTSIEIPKTLEEYDKLIAGSLYIDPETGKTYRKK